MGYFRVVNKLTINRFFSKWNIALWLLILIISFCYEGVRIVEYKSNLDKETKFQEIQQEQFKRFLNYQVYAVYGVRSIFIPSPSSILFNKTIIKESLSAKVDSMQNLKIMYNAKDRSSTTTNLGFKLDFSMIILCFIGIFVLYTGFDTGRNWELNKFLKKISQEKKVAFLNYLSQFIMFFLAYTFFFFSHLLLIVLNGIKLSGVDFYGIFLFYLSSIGALLFFFSIGAIIANKKLSGYVTVGIIIFILVFSNFVIPEIIGFITASKLPSDVEEYQINFDQFIMITDFEIDFAKRHKGFDRKKLDIAQKELEYYINDYYPTKIEALEISQFNRISDAAKCYNNLSMLFPTSFFLLTGSEVSSLGYSNFLGFYNHQIKLKNGYVRFYIDRTVYNDPKIMVNYIKSDENIYRAKTIVPDNFWWGFAISMLWGVLFFFIAVRMTNRRLNGSILKNKEVKDVRIDLHYGNHMVVGSGNRDLIFYLMDVLDGNARPGVGQITIDGKPVERGQKHDYIYIPTATFFPDDLKVGALLDIIGEFAGLSAEGFEKVKSAIDEAYLDKYIRDVSPPDELANMMMALAVASEKKFIIFDSISRNMLDITGIMNTAKQLKENGILIIDFQDGTGRSAWGHLDGNFIFPYRDGTFINGREKVDELYSRFQSKG